MGKEQTKKNIIQAAINEFGTKGYELASTNTIHKQAGVSKGTLFLYYNSKAELFFHSFVEAIKNIISELDKVVLSDVDDVFERMLKATIWKLEYYALNPIESQLMFEAITKPPSEIAYKIKDYVKELSKLSISNFFEDINLDEFSNDYTKEEIISYIQMAISGIQHTVYTPNTEVTYDYLQSIREDALKFVKTVIRGMKK